MQTGRGSLTVPRRPEAVTEPAGPTKASARRITASVRTIGNLPAQGRGQSREARIATLVAIPGAAVMLARHGSRRCDERPRRDRDAEGVGPGGDHAHARG